MKVHLVDGTYELFRAYYAMPSSQNATGIEVAATRGLCRSLITLLREPGVTHVACAFDHVIESFRNDLFAGYKTSEGIEPELWAQFPLAERATRALGIVTWSMVEFEADDALATAAARFTTDPRVTQIVICSPDKDLTQCVQQARVVTWDRMRGNVLDEAGVREKFGVAPASIPDYLALVGDSADGIPGIPRWGAKSSAALLAHFGQIEHIPEDANRWPVQPRGAAALCASLNERRSDAALYKRLAILRSDVPLVESLDDLQWQGADRALLTQLCEEIEDPGLLERVGRFRE
ncbi:MAG TPA: 5'-3' exonuclease H3TH domain-containing protein [Polyangiaceae bacterium]|nr:5'-3' exonuclease H3TH domain-containing protein [Polyangiaceae bacterium]